MTAPIDAKLGVSGAAEFKRNMNEAASSVKNLDAQLKLTEKQFKQNGDAEKYLQEKSRLLKKQMEEQNRVIKEGNNALQAMKARGVDEASKAFQDMERRVYEAQAELINMQTALREVETGAAGAAEKTDQLTASVNGINKKISLDQVISGVNTISTSLENAAKKAVQLGETIWNAIMDRAQWADDTATMAAMWGISTDELQRIQQVASTMGETSVEAIMNARQKIRKGLSDMSDDMKNTFAAMGVDPFEHLGGKYENIEQLRDWEDVFWDVGEALMNMEDQYKREDYAQAVFGRKWQELVPMFKMGRDAYEEALENQDVVTEETINEMAELNDKVTELKNKFSVLETEVLGGLAPALTAAADSISGLLHNLIEYLNTPEGQEMLERMETAISGLFEDLGNIDPETITEGFVGVFEKIIGGFEWLDKNKDTLKNVLTVIVEGWAAAKIMGGALTVWQLIQGISGLAGGASAASSAGAAAGSAWASGFAGAVSTTIATAAPFLTGILGITAAAVAPAVAAQEADYKKAEEERERALEIAAAYEERSVGDSQFIKRAANALGLQRDENGNIETGFMGSKIWGDFAEIEDVLMELSGRKNQQLAELANAIHKYAPYTNGEYTFDLLQEYWKSGGGMDTATATALLENVQKAIEEYTLAGGHYAEGITAPVIEVDARLADDADEHMSMEDFDWPDIEVEPVVPDNAAETISEAVGTVPIAVAFTTGGSGGGGGSGYAMALDVLGNGLLSRYGIHANGLWSVPWDGYPAILHKGERVVPSREVSSRNFSSNLYVESMYMNNGQDSDALAAKVAAENRRIMSGFGSNI